MIIFYEDEYAENLLVHGFKKYMSMRDLCILAKYYRYKGNDKTEIRALLIVFCKKFNPEFNEVRFYDKIQAAVKSTDNYKLRTAISVGVTSNEIAKIKSLEDERQQKILFTMLVIAKYSKLNPVNLKPGKIKPEYAQKFYLNSKFTEIVKLSRVYVRKLERNQLLHSLEMSGLIKTTLNGSFEITFAEKEGELGVLVDDMNDITRFLPHYCEKCGKSLVKKSPKHKYCSECYREIRHDKEYDRLKNWNRGIRIV